MIEAYCRQFHWKCCRAVLQDNWVRAESGEGYRASRDSAVLFRTIIILIISQHTRVQVENEVMLGFFLLAKEKGFLLCFKTNPFSLGEPEWTSGPWKLSNNKGPAAKSPHLFGGTSLSWWFQSICCPHSPIFKLITAAAVINVAQSGIADLRRSTQKPKSKTVFHSNGVDGVTRLKKTAAAQFLWGLLMSPSSLFVGQTAQANWVLLHFYECKWVCAHFNIHELRKAYWGFHPIIHKHIIINGHSICHMQSYIRFWDEQILLLWTDVKWKCDSAFIWI